MIEAAEAAGVKRFIVSDFGWGPSIQGLPELAAVHAQRVASWEAARVRADANPQFTWTGISTGNPIDWALKKFATMGFDVVQRTTIIYDSGMEKFSGTTLEGIGQSVVGVLQDPDATANRFVKVRSINTCQNELLEAFQRVTRQEWPVQRSTTKALLERGRSKLQAGSGGWVLDMVVAQLFDEGQGRCMVAASREESDADLLGVREESAEEIVTKALK
ncbi:hypothetical protein BO71DRAFT_395238 [Aspergillus ellipticus CBS 707.79]|uniref:NmrA-like domain-containing protein n=1 Tax=Aspergillus ellipticus CBS 707.79 TaxID=1448320 RepID=A0A319DLJ7_9EURO|nr:hypothetical protein BO71DRAFT_395238 [Aspergillus ellipticus CBS 707.79]